REAISAAFSPIAAWLHMVRRSRSARSATAPAMGLTTTAGARSQKATRPTQKALPVSSQASQDTAMRCIHSPVQAASDAPKKILALRCDSARESVPREAMARAVAPSVPPPARCRRRAAIGRPRARGVGADAVANQFLAQD